MTECKHVTFDFMLPEGLKSTRLLLWTIITKPILSYMLHLFLILLCNNISIVPDLENLEKLRELA